MDYERLTSEVFIVSFIARIARIAARKSDPDIKRYEAMGSPVMPFIYPTRYEPAKAPSAPKLFIRAIAPPAMFLGKISVIWAKKGPYGTYIVIPAIASNENDNQKLVEPTK